MHRYFPGCPSVAIDVVQGVWVVDRERVLRTVLGACVSVCLYDRKAEVGGMNHYVFARSGVKQTQHSDTRYLSGERCLSGLLDAILKAGAHRENIRAKAFGGASIFSNDSETVAACERNTRFAEQWLENESIILELADFHGDCARKLMFHPSTGRHFCQLISPLLIAA